MKLQQLVQLNLAPLVLLCTPTTAWLGQGAGRERGAALVGESGLHHAKGADAVQALLAEMEATVALRSRESSNSPPSNPSCFFLAVSALPTSAPCEALSRSASARVEVAASMAVCEIKTAGDGEGKVPRECSDWQKGKSKAGVCVEALARSPQHWSSYSGYLREVVTLCSSYRRWADLETARNAYATTASTFATFVEQLQSFEAARARREATEGAARATHHSALAELHNALTSFGTQLDSDHQQHSSELDALKYTLSSTAGTLETLVEALRKEIAPAAEAMARGVQREDELGLSLQTVSTQHAHDLRVAISTFGAELASMLSGVQAGVAPLLEQLSIIDSGLLNLGEAVGAAVEASQGLVRSSQDVSQVLATSLDLGARLQQRMASLHLEQAQELSRVLLNVTQVAAERQQQLGASLAVAFGLRGVVRVVQALCEGLVDVGGGGLALAVLVCTAFIACSHTVSRLLTLVSTLATLYPLLVSAWTLLRFIRGGWRAWSSPRPTFTSTPTPSYRSADALAATHFALAYPPSSSRAGIGSPERVSRASMGAVANLYSGGGPGSSF